MKKHIWEIILAIGLAFLAAGVAGMVIEAIFHPTAQFVIFFWIAIFGLIVALVSIFHSKIYKFWKYLKTNILVVWGVLTHIKESGKLLTLIDEQQKNPTKWLYPVIEYIDLNRQGSAHDDNDVYVRFQIDSHLLFPINEFYVFVKLCLAVPSTAQESKSEWYTIKQPTSYAPIVQLERHNFVSYPLHLVGKTNEEKVLLEWMVDFRKGKSILAMLKVGMAFKKEDGDNPALLEGSCWIAPMNDYRGILE